MAACLCLLIKPTSAKLWRQTLAIETSHERREKLLAIGIYPDVSLKDTREVREDARRLLARGIDPGDKRKADKMQSGNSFADAAAEYLKQQEHQLSSVTLTKARWQMPGAPLLIPAHLRLYLDRVTVIVNRSQELQSLHLTW